MVGNEDIKRRVAQILSICQDVLGKQHRDREKVYCIVEKRLTSTTVKMVKQDGVPCMLNSGNLVK